MHLLHNSCGHFKTRTLPDCAHRPRCSMSECSMRVVHYERVQYERVQYERVVHYERVVCVPVMLFPHACGTCPKFLKPVQPCLEQFYSCREWKHWRRRYRQMLGGSQYLPHFDGVCLGHRLDSTQHACMCGFVRVFMSICMCAS